MEVTEARPQPPSGAGRGQKASATSGTSRTETSLDQVSREGETETYLGDWLKFGDSAVAKFDETLVILPPTTQTDHALSLFCHSCICLGNDSHEFDI